MFSIYERASRDLSYHPTVFVEMVERHGGVETARRLLSTEDIQYGFDKLWEHDRLDLTVEYHVLQPHFKELFNENVRREATRRLKDLGRIVDEDGNLRRSGNA
jgi:hypothetical protein